MHKKFTFYKSTKAFFIGMAMLLIASISYALIQEDDEGEIPEKIPMFAEENEACLQCHGDDVYTYVNEEEGIFHKGRMCDSKVVDSAAFYQSNHYSFMCTDCHSADYDTFPHPGELRFEPMWGCMDCHGYDETFAQYHFEEIAEQYEKSVHYEADPEGFSCWQCHDAHTYVTYARNSENILKTVAYDNNICLKCHGNMDEYNLIDTQPKEEVTLISDHDWLPNQERHFSKVRCIECHTEKHDSLLIPHNVRPKEEAVKNCVECHSSNSMLLASLYKYEVSEERSKYGFLNGPLVQDYYVIGATRNYYLNVASVVIALLIFLGIGIHVILRIKHRKS